MAYTSEAREDKERHGLQCLAAETSCVPCESCCECFTQSCHGYHSSLIEGISSNTRNGKLLLLW